MACAPRRAPTGPVLEMQNRISEDSSQRNCHQINGETAKTQQYHRFFRQTDHSGNAKPDGEDRELNGGRHAVR
jgi:hypothetical protein